LGYRVRPDLRSGYDIRSIVRILRLIPRRSITNFLLPSHSGDAAFIDERLQLSRLVNETRNRVSSDPRDKIFGLLGIAIKTGGIQADYNKSAQEVYVETARALIKEDEHLSILSYAQTKSEYPSWVPDWSTWVMIQFR
jgi:hypothetical protein